MCVGFWSFQAQPSPSNPHFKLILAANRDEVLSRPTARADFWRTKEHTILSGLDKAHIIASTGEEQGNGTWLGINPDTGRLSFLTNFREHPSTWLKESQSRGELVRDYLLHKDKHETTKNHIDCVVKSTSHLYNGFNLVSFDLVQNEAWYATNRFPNRQFRSFELEKDGRIHGVSNGILDPSNESAEWPKVALGKELLRQAIEKSRFVQGTASKTGLIDDLLILLQNSSRAPTDRLPVGMYDYSLEHTLSPICINYEDCFQHFPNKHYGTKTHTLVLVDFNNRVTFIEQDRYMVISDNTGIVLEVQSGEFRREFEFTIGDSASRQR